MLAVRAAISLASAALNAVVIPYTVHGNFASLGSCIDQILAALNAGLHLGHSSKLGALNC